MQNKKTKEEMKKRANYEKTTTMPWCLLGAEIMNHIAVLTWQCLWRDWNAVQVLLLCAHYRVRFNCLMQRNPPSTLINHKQSGFQQFPPTIRCLGLLHAAKRVQTLIHCDLDRIISDWSVTFDQLKRWHKYRKWHRIIAGIATTQPE